ncbi:MAG: hypothetical protein OXN17_17075 [Candidatus Poribacteria bacterium]|nr:hypothetical protein [Candidatus Poribacteria bacterium]MDE0503609.1 hypothetical protein [Candidatus Poribacteria bacterium]
MIVIRLNPQLLDVAKARSEYDLLTLYQDLLDGGHFDDARKIRKHAAYVYPALFYLFYIADPIDFKPFSGIHFEMLDALPRSAQGLNINILAPRGFSKSSLMAVTYPLWKIAYKNWDELLHIIPDRHIVIVSFKQDTAEDRVRDIKSHIESNDKINADFGSLKGAPPRRWRISRLETKNGITLSPYSRTGAIRGALTAGSRPSLIIADDLDNAELALNEEWRKRTMNWVHSDLLRLGAPNGTTNFLFIDTMKHANGISAVLKNTPGWTTLESRTIEHPAALYHPHREIELLWEDWQETYTDMSLPDLQRESQANEFYRTHANEMTTGVIETWREQITYLDVRKEICKTSYFSTMRELQNIAVSTEASTFDMENAVRFKVEDRGFLRSDGRLVLWSDITGFTLFLDDAGGKDAEDRSFAAVVAVAWERMPGGRQFARQNPDSLAGLHAYVIKTWLGRVPPSAQVSAMLDVYDWTLATLSPSGPQCVLAIEERGSESAPYIRGYLAQLFKSECERRKYTDPPTIRWHKQRTNKDYRISSIEPAIKQGWVAFNQRLDPEFESQMSQYPHAQHDDAPDALEGALLHDHRIFQTHDERQLREILKTNRRHRSMSYGVRL